MNREQVDAARAERDRGRARVKGITAGVTVASVAVAGAVAFVLPGSTHANAVSTKPRSSSSGGGSSGSSSSSGASSSSSGSGSSSSSSDSGSSSSSGFSGGSAPGASSGSGVATSGGS